MIYFDNSATTRVCAEAANAAMAAMTETFYNPAAAYTPAIAADKAVYAMRMRLAAAMGRTADEIVYTSGGTESNNTAIFGALGGVRGKRRILTCLTEHPSVYEVFRRLEADPDNEVVYLPPEASGAAALAALEDALTPDTALVSLMHVNNETGGVLDVAAAAARIRKLAPNAMFHVDGVQAFCKLSFAALPCDMYSVSAHKFHAPKGVGALMVRKGARFSGGLIGGGQENGLRSGTTNVPGIAGMDAALLRYRTNQSAYIARMRAVKERLMTNLLTIDDAVVNGPSLMDGAPHILNMSFPGAGGEVLLNALSERGVCVSTGSACSAHRKGKNRVLTAVGVSGARQDSALRFSFCPENTVEEADTVSGYLRELVTFLRRYRRR